MELYHRLSNLPSLPQNIIDEALNARYMIDSTPNVIRSLATGFNNTKFMADLKSAFPNLRDLPNGNCPCIYTLFPANSIYDWHTDYRRLCGVNWVIKTNARALTLFRTQFEHPLDTSTKIELYDKNNLQVKRYWKIDELTYELYQPTIIRTDVDHCMINSYPEDRIILSLSVWGATYEEVKDYLCGLNISEY